MRHAEAERGSSQCSKTDFGLTNRGKAHAERIGSKLNEPIDRILTSSLPRSIETGEIVAKSLGQHTPEVVNELSEIGELESRENESLENFFARIESTMNQIAEQNTVGTTLAITHAGFIMGSVRALFDIPTPGTGARLEPSFLSLTEWTKQDDIWELRYFNL
jgi:broad specificity phosphatase PhoE